MKRHHPTLKAFSFIAALLAFGMTIDQTAMATGPRVTANLFSPHTNEIYAADLPPFIGTGHPGGGLLAEIVTHVLEAEQVESVLTTLPLLTMIKYYLIQENALAALGRNLKLSEKEQAALIFIPIFVAREQYLYHRPSHGQPLLWEGRLGELAGLNFGATKGEDVSLYESAGIKVSYGRIHGLFKKLATGKIDFIRMPSLTTAWMLKTHFNVQRTDFVPLDETGQETPLYLIFNKGHKEGEEIAARFRGGLLALLDSGHYLEILEKHLGKDPVNEQRVTRLRDHLTP